MVELLEGIHYVDAQAAPGGLGNRTPDPESARVGLRCPFLGQEASEPAAKERECVVKSSLFAPRAWLLDGLGFRYEVPIAVEVGAFQTLAVQCHLVEDVGVISQIA